MGFNLPLQLARPAKLLFALGACIVSSPALAIPVTPDCDTQTAPIGTSSPPLPENFAPSVGGVDMRSGQYLYSHTDLQIGGADGLRLERMFSPIWKGNVTYYGPFGYLTHNYDVWIDEDRIAVCTSWEPYKKDFEVRVVVGSRIQTFRSDYVMNPVDGLGRQSGGPHSRLTFEGYESGNGVWVPTRYIFEDSDGTKYRFQAMNDGPWAGRTKKIDQIIKPDGTTLDFVYGAGGLDTITSNRGYALHFTYSPMGLSPTGNTTQVVTEACVLNVALSAPPALGSACPAGSVKSTYAYTSGSVSSYTDQGGVATLLGPKATKVYHPGETTPYLTNTLTHTVGTKNLTNSVVSSQTFADGRQYNYSWTLDSNFWPQALGGSYTSSQGTVSVKYKEFTEYTGNGYMHMPSNGPIEVKDELGRKKTYVYQCHSCNILTAYDPGGQTRTYEYGPFSQVTKITHVASGMSPPAIVETKQYGCTSSACYQKPTKVTDGRANSTDFEYFPEHGGVKSETGPAGPDGVRPQKRFSYTQRAAWVSDGAGGYTKNAAEVWLLTGEELCRTSAADSNGNCAAGASDEVVTVYEYGPDSGPNNLLLRGAAVTSNGVTLRTCYGYDALGRKISETKPSASLAVCP